MSLQKLDALEHLANLEFGQVDLEFLFNDQS